MIKKRTWKDNEWLTPEQIEQAKRLRTLTANGRLRCWRKIAKAIGVSEYKIRIELDPNYKTWKERRNFTSIADKRSRKYGFGNVVHVPDKVLEERDKLLNAMPQSLSAMLFNDPPVGYSALDKKLKEKTL